MTLGVFQYVDQRHPHILEALRLYEYRLSRPTVLAVVQGVVLMYGQEIVAVIVDVLHDLVAPGAHFPLLP